VRCILKSKGISMQVQSDRHSSVEIAVVGDVHDQWEAADGVALRRLGVDLVMFVGDFGNESVEVVRAIAALELPKAVILGNHDAWFTASPWGNKHCPYDRSREDRVQQQLDLLGTVHIGYGKLDFPELDITVVGGRPFSWGGSDWKNEKFYRTRFGVRNFEESAARIVAAAQSAACNTVLFLGHCGPTGLGDRPEDPCGKDWEPLGGDFGDPDLAAAIAQTRQAGTTIPLVAFGHMHHALRHTQHIQRRSIGIDDAGTVYVNTACVPRIVQTGSNCQRHFCRISLQECQVTQVAQIWIDQDFAIASQQILYRPPRLARTAEKR